MSDQELKKAITKLAAEKPELRKHLVPLLKKKATADSVGVDKLLHILRYAQSFGYGWEWIHPRYKRTKDIEKDYHAGKISLDDLQELQKVLAPQSNRDYKDAQKIMRLRGWHWKPYFE